MVRFENSLRSNAIAGWEASYLNYAKLKGWLYMSDAELEAKDQESSSAPILGAGKVFSKLRRFSALIVRGSSKSAGAGASDRARAASASAENGASDRAMIEGNVSASAGAAPAAATTTVPFGGSDGAAGTAGTAKSHMLPMNIKAAKKSGNSGNGNSSENSVDSLGSQSGSPPSATSVSGIVGLQSLEENSKTAAAEPVQQQSLISPLMHGPSTSGGGRGGGSEEDQSFAVMNPLTLSLSLPPRQGANLTGGEATAADKVGIDIRENQSQSQAQARRAEMASVVRDVILRDIIELHTPVRASVSGNGAVDSSPRDKASRNRFKCLRDKKFRQMLAEEIIKVEDFYVEQIAEINTTLELLRSQAAATKKLGEKKKKEKHGALVQAKKEGKRSDILEYNSGLSSSRGPENAGGTGTDTGTGTAGDDSNLGKLLTPSADTVGTKPSSKKPKKKSNSSDAGADADADGESSGYGTEGYGTEEGDTSGKDDDEGEDADADHAAGTGAGAGGGDGDALEAAAASSMRSQVSTSSSQGGANTHAAALLGAYNSGLQYVPPSLSPQSASNGEKPEGPNVSTVAVKPKTPFSTLVPQRSLLPPPPQNDDEMSGTGSVGSLRRRNNRQSSRERHTNNDDDDDNVSQFSSSSKSYGGVSMSFIDPVDRDLVTIQNEKLYEAARASFAAMSPNGRTQSSDVDEFIRKSVAAAGGTAESSTAEQKNLLAYLSAQRAYNELYDTLGSLESYTLFNNTALRKIAKKHDKLLISSRKQDSTPAKGDGEEDEEDADPAAKNSKILSNSDRYKVREIGKSSITAELREHLTFMAASEIAELRKEYEILYADVFCKGSVDIAKATLFIERKGKGGDSVLSSAGDPRNFRLGLRIGVIVVLLSWIIWDAVLDFAYQEQGVLNTQFASCHNSAVDTGRINNGENITSVWFAKVFPIWRGMLGIIVAVWVWAALLWTWGKYRINYLLMLGLDPRITAGVMGTCWTAANLSIVYLVCFLVHFKVLRCDFPQWPTKGSLGLWSVVPFGFIIYACLFPWVERRQMWAAFGNVMIAPFVEVTFLMNFAGDVMTSLVKPINDMAYALCFYISGDWLQHIGDNGACQDKSGFLQKGIVPLILLAPYWLRLMQCLRRYNDTGKRHPNLPNAFKYALSMCITVFGIANPSFSQPFGFSTMQVFWMIAYMTSTCYSWWWDVFMDWSALHAVYPVNVQAAAAAAAAADGTRQRRISKVDRASSANNGTSPNPSPSPSPGVEPFSVTCPEFHIRSRRMVGGVWNYRIVIVLDLLLRFFWAYTLIPYSRSNKAFGIFAQYVAPIAAVAEIFRRGMWSVFRLENEHLHNTEQFRNQKHIPLHYAVPDAVKKEDSKSVTAKIRVEVGIFVAIVLIVTVVAVLYRAK